MKTKTKCIAAILAALTCLRAEAAESLSQSETVHAVLRDNPSLKAARAKWEAMKARVPQARAWENLDVGVDFQRGNTTRFDTFTDIEYMAAQAIPVSGKNLSQGRAAIAEAAIALEELRRAELDAVSKARVACYRLANGYAQLEINRKNEKLLEQIAEISRVKYEAGIQNQSDVLLAQTDLAKLPEARAAIERDISDQQSQLNALMGRPATASLAAPAPLVFMRYSFPPENIRALAVGHRPEILMAAAKVDAEKTRVQLAQKQWFPDPLIRVQARQFNGSSNSGISEYDTGVFFSVPWVNYSKYSAGVREARQNKLSAEQSVEAARNEALAMVRDQLRKLYTAATNYELFRDKLVPLATQTVQSTRTNYESDKTDFLTLMTARRTAQDVESTLANYLAEYHIAVAELAAIIGTNPLRVDLPTEIRNSK